MCGGGNLGDAVEHLDVLRAMIEIIVANQAPVRLPSRCAVFRFVDLLEQGALVPGGSLEFLERLAQLFLRQIQDADLERLIGLGIADQIMKASPCGFQFLEILLVHDGVDLLGKSLVDLCDDRLDRLDGVLANEGGLRQSLLGQGMDRGANSLLDPIRLRFELLVQQGLKLIDLQRGGLGLPFRRLCLFFFLSHWTIPPGCLGWTHSRASGRLSEL